MKATAPSAELRRLVKSADAAMLRAALRAREVAARTGTRLIVEKDGKLQRLAVGRGGKLPQAKIPRSKNPKK